MLINFICVGNAWRSIIAEAYFNSLQISGVKAISMGSSAERYRESNRKKHAFEDTLRLLKSHNVDSFAKSHYGDPVPSEGVVQGDVAICMNKIVLDECKNLGKMPERILVWDITDDVELERRPETDEEKEQYKEFTYKKIVKEVDRLVKDLGLS